MSDIELVIKINKNTYNNFIRNEYSRVDVIAMHTALTNGTPLPPHGKLIDADAIDTSYSDPEVVETLRDAPAIIEANKAESEEKNEQVQI